MDTVVHGDLITEGLEVILRNGCYLIHYDAGAHQNAWREDELSEQEFERLRQGGSDERSVIIALQERLQMLGKDPFKQNWSPKGD